MRNKKYKPAADNLRGEQKWDMKDWRYPAIKKITLSGSLQTQPRPLKGVYANGDTWWQKK